MISSLEFGIGLDFCTPFKASPIRFLTSNMEMFSFNSNFLLFCHHESIMILEKNEDNMLMTNLSTIYLKIVHDEFILA